MTSQKAALPAAVAMPTPEGPPLTSLVTSVDSMWPESADAAVLRLRETRMVGEAVGREQVLQRAGGSSEAQRIDRQHGDLRRDVVAAVAGRFELPRQGFTEDHPERVAGRGAVARRQHEFVGVRMLRAAIVVVQTTLRAAGKMRGDVEGRIREGSAKMAGLRVIAEQHQRHGRHEADVFHVLLVLVLAPFA